MFAPSTAISACDDRDEVMDPEDVAEAVLFASTQLEKARSFLIGLRPMSEPL